MIPAKNLELSERLLEELADTDIPEFVLGYGKIERNIFLHLHTWSDTWAAPLVFLDKGDDYYPSDLAAHIVNTHPTVNFTSIEGIPTHLSLDNLDKLNDFGGDKVYLTSTKSAIKLPKFLHGKKPGASTLRTHHARSCVVIVVEKEDGIIDAFYMYFYSFNAGPSALGHTAGNHVGDW